MLSFLQDQELANSSVQDPSTAGDSNGEPQEQEYVAVAAQKRRVRKTTYLLAVLFCVGLLCLWFMIKKSAPGAATAAAVGTEESQIGKAIAQLIGVRSEMFSGLEKIVSKFYEFSDVQQVQVNELVKNPFKHEVFWGGLSKDSGSSERNSGIDAEVMRQQQLMQQAEDIQLLSIMQSEEGNCCMIDDKILYEGDSIRGFKVRQIGDNFVNLELEDTDPEDNKGRSGTQIVLMLSE